MLLIMFIIENFPLRINILLMIEILISENDSSTENITRCIGLVYHVLVILNLLFL